MADDYEDMSDGAPPSDHPALKGHNSLATKINYVVGKTLKGLAWGALAAVAVMGAIAVAGGAGLAAAGPWAWLATLVGGGAAAYTKVITTEMVAKALVGTLLLGGGIGAAAGAVSGMSGAEDAADDKAAQLVFNYERGERRQEMAEKAAQVRKQQWIEMNKQEQQLGLSPSIGRFAGKTGDYRGI